MPREKAKALHDFLHEYLGEAEIARYLAMIIRAPIDARIKLVAAVIAADILLFQYKLRENMGQSGVRIRVWGPSLLDVRTTLQEDGPVLTWPIYHWLYEGMVPEGTRKEIKNWAEKARAGATIPVLWRVSPID